MADAVGAILLASVTMYAVFGGADFGAGLWDLLAGTTPRGRRPRGLIDESITPVWEANHVWLVFDLVIFWTAFPRAFASVMTALALPLWLAVGGIVLACAALAFRQESTPVRLARRRARRRRGHRGLGRGPVPGGAAAHRGNADQCRRHPSHVRGPGRRGYRRRHPGRPFLRPAVRAAGAPDARRR